MSVVLTTTWLPRGELARLERFYPRLDALYEAVIVVLPPDVDEAIRNALDALPKVKPVIMGNLGEGWYLSLKHALDTTADYIHYVDMDRLIRWVETRPDELRETVQQMQTTDYVLIGRTPQAFATHPQAMQQTEILIHRVFSHLLGGEYDFCAGSKGMNLAVADYIVAHCSKDRGLGTDTEWSVLAQQGGFQIGSLLVDGLDWETADRYLDRAADAETQQREAALRDADPKEWAARVDLAQRIIEAGLKARTS